MELNLVAAFSKVKVLDGGFSTTLQDGGRLLGRSYGVPSGGVLDRSAWAIANQLVQNPSQAAALEIILHGPTLYFENAALIAITGADLRAELSDGRSVPNWLAFFVRAGQTLVFNGPKNRGKKWGRCAYLAIHGGWDAPLVMGSRSTYTRAAIGGYQGLGRALQNQDELQSRVHTLKHLVEGAARVGPASQRPSYQDKVSLGLIPGPHHENFAPHTLSTLLSNSYELTNDADRMGFRLQGKPLAHAMPETAEISSCATVFGAIQVPPNGQPIVLMADHQVTGGYPILASVINSDLPLLAQLLPGGEVRFRLSTPAL